MTSLPRRLTATLLFLVFAFCVYRARTQSLVIDEAWVFERFVNQPFAEMARSWDACNHVLHTVITKWFRNRFGIGEIALRLGTLLGTAIYLTAVYRLSALIFSGWRQPVVAGLLVLHPLVMDFLVAARGYGLALGLFTWSLYCVVAWSVRDRNRRWITSAGVLGGLSVAANLTFAVPVAALALTLFFMEWRSAVPATSIVRSAMQSLWRVTDTYAGPALVVATLIVLLPLLQAQPSHFYYGERNVVRTLERLFETVLKSEFAVFTSFGAKLVPWSGYALALLLAGVSAVAAVGLWRREHERFRYAPLTLAAGTLAFSGILICILGAFGVPYPSGRTGIYLIPLFTIPVALLFQHRRVLILSGFFVMLIYVTENDARYFADWRWDSGTRQLLLRLEDERLLKRLGEPVSVAVSAPLSSTAKYHKERRRIPWLEIMPEDSRDAQYVLLDSRHIKVAESPEFEIILKHELSGATLARRVQ